MRELMWFWVYGIAVALAACSIITDSDEFTYIEGSASDNGGGDGDSDGDTDGDSDGDSDGDADGDSDGDADGDSDTENDSDTWGSDWEGIIGNECDDDGDCESPAYCPQFFETSSREELISHCYLDCSDDPDVCFETSYPYCYEHDRGAVCLDRASIVGPFVCRRAEITENNAVNLWLGEEADPITLRECEIIIEEGNVGFLFRALHEGDIIEAAFYLPGIEIGGVSAGLQDNARGMAYRQQVDEDSGNFTPTARFILAVFPPDEPEQDTPISREIDIDEISLAGPIKGDIDFEGFVYDAEISID